MAIYLASEIYDRLVAALLNPEPDPVTGEPSADAIRVSLGEIADVWPASILPHGTTKAVLDRAAQVSAITE